MQAYKQHRKSAGAPRIGFAAVPAAQVAKGALIEGWIDMKDEEGNDVQMRGKKVRDSVCIVPCSIQPEEEEPAQADKEQAKVSLHACSKREDIQATTSPLFSSPFLPSHSLIAVSFILHQSPKSSSACSLTCS